MATFVLFSMMLLLMFMRIRLPLGARAQGKPAKTVGLSLMERFIYQRTNIYAIGLIVLLATITGLLAPSWELMIVLICLGFLLLPVHVIATTRGIGVNNVVFRPWDDFIGFAVERRRIRLLPRKGLRPLYIPVMTGKQEQLLPVIRRYVKQAGAASVSS